MRCGAHGAAARQGFAGAPRNRDSGRDLSGPLDLHNDIVDNGALAPAIGEAATLGQDASFAACEDGPCWKLRGARGWEPDEDRTAARLTGQPFG